MGLKCKTPCINEVYLCHNMEDINSFSCQMFMLQIVEKYINIICRIYPFKFKSTKENTVKREYRFLLTHGGKREIYLSFK